MTHNLHRTIHDIDYVIPIEINQDTGRVIVTKDMPAKHWLQIADDEEYLADKGYNYWDEGEQIILTEKEIEELGLEL